MKSMKKDGIVLNRMYVGEYIFNNLGHEIINMYAADNGKHYLYLNATGNYEKKHKGRIDTMLLTKSHKQNVVEVISMATGLEDVPGADQSLGRNYKGLNNEIRKEQEDYIKQEGEIKYGGIPILQIFNDAEQQSIFITYKAKNFYKPNSPVFIAFDSKCTNKDIPHGALLVKLSQLNWAKTSLKQYIYPETADKDYQTIMDLVNNSNLWEKNNTKVNGHADVAKREISLIDICHLQNDENCFSDMLAYFMEQERYRGLWEEFFEKAKCYSNGCLLGIKLKGSYSVTREKDAKIDGVDSKKCPNGGRIDLFIRDQGKNIVVIENKIKSDINSISTDKNHSNQLRRYYNYVNWLIKKEGNGNEITPHFLIMAPNYNIPDVEEERDKNQELLVPQMSDIYKIITYKELYDFLSTKKKEFENDANFVAFYEAMRRHTYPNVNAYLYYEMEEKFIRRIKEFS
ncbi:MAG: PD-(D/E)XK nuclease family protein [Bacteroidetes bacterium]|uniref:PD-(D/E)XK nuclease family protein n=1 Tax=Candidatus Gallipaludibacter merdavium TaxID=2840839 RepID=A0A9D9N4F8_9BACT|nr:PD-(D/E)XK nuclease family protein [Candidatus Gallipaludibacter merdavium]